MIGGAGGRNAWRSCVRKRLAGAHRDEEGPALVCPADPSSGPLDTERRQLTHARHCLQQMGEALRTLDPHGGDPVSTEYLKAELYRRAQALLDDPTTPLFFGRIDRADASERFYVGRRHVRDAAGDPVVVDWRAG